MLEQRGQGLCYLFGADDQSVKSDYKTTDWSNLVQSFLYVARNVIPKGSPIERAFQVVKVAVDGSSKELVELRCERGAQIARGLDFPEETAEAIRTLDEHWDGRGQPEGLQGDAIPLLGRILGLAQTVEIFFSTYGEAAAFEMVARRRGTWFDPTLVHALISTREDVAFWQRLVGDDPRTQLAALEPEERVLMADDACLDRIAQAFAEVIDAKSSWTFRHSQAVAEIAVGVGQVLGFSHRDLRQVERAALLHDLGKLGISNRILDKPTGLTEQERAAMSRHAEYTQRILGRVASFRDVAALAGAHHERLDGQGYHRGIGAAELPMAARVIKVADICEALSVDRPYRPALAREEVFQIMGRDVGASICPEAFEALRVFLERDNPSPASAQPPIRECDLVGFTRGVKRCGGRWRMRWISIWPED